MKKAILILLMVLIPSFVYAIKCDDMEYAELKDMDKEQLQNVFCQTRYTFMANKKLAASGYNDKASRDNDACLALLKKIENAYFSKFKEKINEEICKPKPSEKQGRTNS